MQKRVFIVHGWEGKPESNWFPWLKRGLEARSVEVHVPEMPDAKHPKADAWLAALTKAVVEPTKDTYFVGHSLGAIAVLRYLHSLPKGTRVGGAVLVAGFDVPISFVELNNFFETPLDVPHVKAAAGQMCVVHGDNDPYVPMACGENLRDRYGAEFVLIRNGGHLNASDGFTELPIVLERLDAMMKN